MRERTQMKARFGMRDKKEEKSWWWRRGRWFLCPGAGAVVGANPLRSAAEFLAGQVRASDRKEPPAAEPAQRGSAQRARSTDDSCSAALQAVMRLGLCGYLSPLAAQTFTAPSKLQIYSPLNRLHAAKPAKAAASVGNKSILQACASLRLCFEEPSIDTNCAGLPF